MMMMMILLMMMMMILFESVVGRVIIARRRRPLPQAGLRFTIQGIIFIIIIIVIIIADIIVITLSLLGSICTPGIAWVIGHFKCPTIFQTYCVLKSWGNTVAPPYPSVWGVGLLLWQRGQKCTRQAFTKSKWKRVKFLEKRTLWLCDLYLCSKPALPARIGERNKLVSFIFAPNKN